MPQTTPPRIWLARGLGVQDASGGDGTDDAGDADDAELLVDVNFGKDRRVHVVRTSGVLGGGRRLFLLDALHAAVAHRIRNGHRARTVVLADKLAVDERELVGGGIGERRIRHLLCQAQQLAADRLGGRDDSVRHRSRDPRSAFDRRLRQARVAEFDADAVERQSERVGRDLRHDGVGAGADVGGRARHLRVSVGAENDAHGDRHLHCFPHARRHPPADQIAAVTHRAWLGVALAPPERVGALAVAFAQGLAAERPVFMLVAVRVTPQTQFDGIELERDRELVHRGFERIHARRRARRAHVARGRQIQVSEPVRVASRLRICRAGRTSPSPADKSLRIARSR